VDTVVLLAAAWVACSVVACFGVAAVVARAEHPPNASPSVQPAPRPAVMKAAPDDPSAPPEHSALPDAA
jgi:hypothetical protein